MVKEAFLIYYGVAVYWLTPSHWYWSKDCRRARKFAKEYMAEARERGLIDG